MLDEVLRIDEPDLTRRQWQRIAKVPGYCAKTGDVDVGPVVNDAAATAQMKLVVFLELPWSGQATNTRQDRYGKFDCSPSERSEGAKYCYVHHISPYGRDGASARPAGKSPSGRSKLGYS